ncbi:MAG: archaeal flagellar protein FlaJ [Candidatus Woesearchaeota archaeon]|nr:archaeal flagellar protein FlaJ [Candidatus Woesearchaeota archaeon]
MKKKQQIEETEKGSSLFHELGRVVIPNKIRPRLRDYLLKAGIEEVPYSLIGIIVVLALLFSSLFVVFSVVPNLEEVILPDIGRELTFFETLGLLITNKVVYINFFKVFGYLFLALGASLLIVFVVFYSFFEYRIYERTVSMEKVLPDFLRQVSQNLKAGLTLDRALWNSIDPSYKELSFEIRLMAKRVMVGEDLVSALFEFAKKYNSAELLRTFSLLAESNKSGSEMAHIVDNIVDSLEKNKVLEDEIRATSTAYTIFISLIVIAILPLLFSITYNLLGVLGSMAESFSAVGNVQNVNLPLNLAELKISFDPQLVNFFIIGAILVSSFTASMLVSVIRGGNFRGTLRYVVIYCPLSIIVYRLIFFFISNLFSSLFSAI